MFKNERRIKVRKKLFTSFTLVMCMALILVVQAQAQVTIDKNGDMYVEKGLKGSFPGSAIVIDGDGYLNIETGLKGKAAPVEKTGQKNCYYGDGEIMVTCTCGTTNCPSGQDGDLEKGVTWPNPRFTDNGNGTVTDNLTGLIWLKDANCTQFWFLDFTGPNGRSWSDALTAANALANGYCGLSDGSDTGDWHLPNRNELLSLVDIDCYDPALSNAAGTAQWSEGDPFTGVQSSYYWSSATYVGYPSLAWGVLFGSGSVYNLAKSSDYYVWCVRGGH